MHAYQKTEASEDPVASLPAKTGLQGGHQGGEDDGAGPGSTGGDTCNQKEHWFLWAGSFKRMWKVWALNRLGYDPGQPRIHR